MMTPRPIRAAFVLLPQFSHLGLTLAAEPLFLTNWLCRRSVIDWTTLSVDGHPVVTSSGATVPVDGSIHDDQLFDTVFVFASFDPRAVTTDKRLAHWLRRQARFGAEMQTRFRHCWTIHRLVSFLLILTEQRVLLNQKLGRLP